MSPTLPAGNGTENTSFQEQYYPPFSSSCRIGRIFTCQKIASSSDSFILVSSSKPSKYIQNKSTYSVKVSTFTQINSYKYFTPQSGEIKNLKNVTFLLYSM